METVTIKEIQHWDSEETLMTSYGVTELVSYIKKLRRERSTSQTEHAQDIELIGEMAIQMADDLGWCDKYDEFVDGLNNKLHIKLPTREKEYEARVRVTVYLSATVNASSESDAEEKISEMFDKYEIVYDGSDFEIYDRDLDNIEAIEQ